MERKQNLCMYTEADLQKCENLLKATIVRYIIDKNITFDQFSKLHQDYLYVSGIPNLKVASTKNNLLKSMRLGPNATPMTYERFKYIMLNIFGENIQNFSIELKHRDGGPTKRISMDWLTY